VATPSPTVSPTPSPTPAPSPTPTPDFWGLRTSTPEEQGVDSALLVQMFDHIDEHQLDLRSILVVRNGHMLVEAYFYPHHRNTAQSISSCTKSFTSALLGIAIEEGYVDSVDAKLLDFFPHREFSNPDPRKADITLEHLLTMRSGIDWPESSVSYENPDNILRQMFSSADYTQFVLDRPMAADPGSTYNYSTGDSNLLGAAIEAATGMALHEYAQERLFDPIGADPGRWVAGPEGLDFGGGGLLLPSRSLATFGQLYLQEGVWSGRQVVPTRWVEESTSGPGYGYQWWLLGNGGYAALGYPGNRIVVLPHLQMVIVVTGELAGADSRYLIDGFIVPAAAASQPLPENEQAIEELEARIAAAGQAGY
jgi:CubicO group peptidase (beta-lactamase class C family)